MSDRMLHMTTIIAIIAAFVLVVLSMVDIFSATLEIPMPVYFSCIIFLLGAFLSYVYVRSEDIDRRVSGIERRMSGAAVEVFRTRDEWLGRMIDLGTNSPFIATLHYSDPPSLLGGRSGEYFRRINAAIRRSGSRMVYRRVATASTPDKVRWMLRCVEELRDCDNFSLAYIDCDHRRTPLLCVEVGEDRGVYYTFLFSTVPTHGEVSAVLIRDNAVGEAIYSAFERIWSSSHKIKEGGVINFDVIQEIAGQHGLLDSSEYQAVNSLKR